MNGSRPLRENQERRLKRVFHVLVVPQNLSADHPNKPTMPLDDLGKRALIALPHKTHQQLAVGGGNRAGMIYRALRQCSVLGSDDGSQRNYLGARSV
jgi:hypothetical protein